MGTMSEEYERMVLETAISSISPNEASNLAATPGEEANTMTAATMDDDKLSDEYKRSVIENSTRYSLEDGALMIRELMLTDDTDRQQQQQGSIYEKNNVEIFYTQNGEISLYSPTNPSFSREETRTTSRGIFNHAAYDSILYSNSIAYTPTQIARQAADSIFDGSHMRSSPETDHLFPSTPTRPQQEVSPNAEMLRASVPLTMTTQRGVGIATKKFPETSVSVSEDEECAYDSSYSAQADTEDQSTITECSTEQDSVPACPIARNKITFKKPRLVLTRVDDASTKKKNQAANEKRARPPEKRSLPVARKQPRAMTSDQTRKLLSFSSKTAAVADDEGKKDEGGDDSEDEDTSDSSDDDDSPSEEERDVVERNSIEKETEEEEDEEEEEEGEEENDRETIEVPEEICFKRKRVRTPAKLDLLPKLTSDELSKIPGLVKAFRETKTRELPSCYSFETYKQKKGPLYAMKLRAKQGSYADNEKRPGFTLPEFRRERSVESDRDNLWGYTNGRRNRDGVLAFTPIGYNVETLHVDLGADGAPLVPIFETLEPKFPEDYTNRFLLKHDKVGDALKLLSECEPKSLVFRLERSHDECTNYVLTYGMIPSFMKNALLTLFNSLMPQIRYRPVKKIDPRPENRRPFLDGELELLTYVYWRVSHEDMEEFAASENGAQSRAAKVMLREAIASLPDNTIKHTLIYYFGRPNEPVSRKLAVYLKKEFKNILAHVHQVTGDKFVEQYRVNLWGKIMEKLKLHHYCCKHTIALLFNLYPSYSRALIHLAKRCQATLTVNDFSPENARVKYAFKVFDNRESMLELLRCMIEPRHITPRLANALNYFVLMLIKRFVRYLVDRRMYPYHRQIGLRLLQGWTFDFKLSLMEYQNSDFPVTGLIESSKTKKNIKRYLLDNLCGEVFGNLKTNTEITTRCLDGFCVFLKEYVGRVGYAAVVGGGDSSDASMKLLADNLTHAIETELDESMYRESVLDASDPRNDSDYEPSRDDEDAANDEDDDDSSDDDAGRGSLMDECRDLFAETKALAENDGKRELAFKLPSRQTKGDRAIDASEKLVDVSLITEGDDEDDEFVPGKRDPSKITQAQLDYIVNKYPFRRSTSSNKCVFCKDKTSKRQFILDETHIVVACPYCMYVADVDDRWDVLKRRIDEGVLAPLLSRGCLQPFLDVLPNVKARKSYNLVGTEPPNNRETLKRRALEAAAPVNEHRAKRTKREPRKIRKSDADRDRNEEDDDDGDGEVANVDDETEKKKRKTPSQRSRKPRPKKPTTIKSKEFVEEDSD